MRGITPVITTVLLLLMAVAAVGGAWVWYQRMQSSAQTGGQAGVEKIKGGTGVQYLFIDTADDAGDGNLSLVIGNQGPEIVNITEIKVNTGSGLQKCQSTFSSNTISPSDFQTFNCTAIDYPGDGNTITVKLYAGAVTKDIVLQTG